MSQSEPEIITMERLRRVSSAKRGSCAPFLGDSEAVTYRFKSRTYRLSVAQYAEPFNLEHARLAYVTSGKCVMTINGIDHPLQRGSLLLVMQDDLVQVTSVTEDFGVSGLAFGDAFVASSGIGSLSLSSGRNRVYPVLSLNEEECDVADQLFGLLWSLVSPGVYDDATLSSHMATLLRFYVLMWNRHETSVDPREDSALQMFELFLAQLQRSAATHHDLPYYADALCITIQYLCVTVKKSSGKSPKMWIDRAVVMHAKKMLRWSKKSMASIAKELRFLDTDSFGKFFRRMTGVTPSVYRTENTP